MQYVRGLADGSAKRTVGHNPAGAVMILLLLASLAGTTGTGLALYAVEEGRGPLAGLITTSTPGGGEVPAASASSRAGDDDDAYGERGESREGGEGDEDGGGLAGLHKFFVYLTLALAGLHIAGVIASSLAHGENLVRSMVTGRKRAE